MDFTDLLLICILWFQVANLLYQLWPKLMWLKHRGKAESKEDVKGKDVYEEIYGGEKT